MAKQNETIKWIGDIANNPKNTKIDFSDIPKILFKAKNISDTVLTGEASKLHRFNSINIIHSVLNKFRAKKVNFCSSDIKDCSIKGSDFEYCNFNDAAHINNDVSNARFYKCTFSLTSVTDSEYRDSLFIECDFTNIIISSSRFNKCKFIKCTTSNKLVESSLLFDCKFEETNIQPETIIENFGLSKESLLKCKIRIQKSVNKKILITPEELSSNLISQQLSTIENFLLSYFHNPIILMEGSEDIDSTFNYMNWLKLSKNPNRFRLLIERYHDFILFNYEKDQAPFWLILKLHKMTDQLTREIDSLRVDLYRSIMGVHMSLSRLVEKYLQLCEQMLVKYSEEQEIRFLVKGPLDSSYYYVELSNIFEQGALKIKTIVKHNSPNELVVVWQNIKDLLPMITVFLATRVKFAIQKLALADELLETDTSKALRKTTDLPSVKTNQVVDIIKTEFGFDKDVNNYMFKLRAILPGNLLIHLNLELQTKMFGKIKKIILDLLPQSRTKI